MGKWAAEWEESALITDRQYLRYIQMDLERTSNVGFAMRESREGMIIWRNVMRERQVLVSHDPEVLGEEYEQEKDNSYHIIYSNDSGHVYLAR